MKYLKMRLIIILVFFASSSFITYKKKKEYSTLTSTTTGGSTTDSTPTPANPPAVANITVTSVSFTNTLTGSCGWAVDDCVYYIDVSDNLLSQRALAINCNVTNLPYQITTYSIVASSTIGLSLTNIVDMNFTQITGNNLLSWESTNTS